jgi:hypothetical protein
VLALNTRQEKPPKAETMHAQSLSLPNKGFILFLLSVANRPVPNSLDDAGLQYHTFFQEWSLFTITDSLEDLRHRLHFPQSGQYPAMTQVMLEMKNSRASPDMPLPFFARS